MIVTCETASSNNRIIFIFIFTTGMLSEEAQEAMNKEYRNCRLFHSRIISGTSTNEDVMHHLQISSDPYINSFRIRMKLKKLEYHDVQKLLIE